ncbi:Sporulation and spore germination [Nonomuraea solani]|uniref:Sporulation and spore germination n=1 Tax=Nonomuraea solani TaxID=1144553 RepID=A0A1H6C0U3_9ACTN|nr:LpqB family beta-propeller domain-containing protein [Nonomuraea solani]SEG66493.1 Sporulation and spore germination [Nonomuraea solani]
MTRIRRFVAITAIAASVCCSGCTVIPASGPYTVDEAGAGDPLSKPFQRMIAIEPQPSWSPEQTIRGMQAAMAAYPDDPETLLKYLTPKARAKWNASGPVAVIEDQYEVVPDASRDGTETVQKVSIKGRWVAAIQEDDSYLPTVGGMDRVYDLVKNPKGGYLIDALPNELVLTASDVARAYRPTNLYYPSRNTQDRLVVDRLRLRLKPTERFAQTVLERLLEPPTGALQGAVLSSFPPGTKIESVTSGEERVVINLSGPLDLLDLSAEDALRAQIRFTLNKNDIAKGRIIEIQVDGEPYTVDRPNSDENWLSNGGESAYYISKGALHSLGKDGPMGAVPGAAGEPREGYEDFALSKESNASIAARTATGISVAGLTQEGRWQEVIPGTDLTPPTWHRDGSLWTYDRANAVLLRYDPAGGRGAERVAAPKLVGLDVTKLRIARDGVRVVVATGKNTVQIGALTGEGAGMMLGNFQALTTTEESDEVVDVAWEDDEHVLVLVKSSKAVQILNQINVGDGETVGVPLKDRLESLAALEDRILAESTTDKGTKILELNQDRQNWTPKVETNAGAPLFPLG